MKKVLAFGCSVLLLCTFAVFPANAVYDPIPGDDLIDMDGDVNTDGAVDLLDALFLFEAVSGKHILIDQQALNADINYDGVVDIRDAEQLYCTVSGA